MTPASTASTASPSPGPAGPVGTPRTPGSPLLALPGAVPADPPDEGVAAHHGDPLREQRELAEGAGLVDRSHRGVVRVSGPDRLSWLHSLTSQHLSELPPMRGAEALVLSPHGHVEHHLVLADDGESTWIDVEPGTSADLTGFLDRMRFLLRVEVADVSADWAVLSLGGPDAERVLSAAYGVVPGGAAYDVVGLPGGGRVRRMPSVVTADLLVPRAELAAAADRLLAAGARPVGVAAYEAVRVAARVPRRGLETDHRTIPHEVGWLATAVHLDKGCYRGQETVARVHNLGRPPRRLVLLHLDGVGEALPASREPVLADGRPIGFVTTAARHHELGPVALALVKRATPDDAELVVGPAAAAIDRG